MGRENSGRRPWIFDGLTKWERYRRKKLAAGLCATCTKPREELMFCQCNSCRAKYRMRKHEDKDKES